MAKNPPSGGPTTGPSRPGMVRNAITLTISAFGTTPSMTPRPTGTIMAPPTPCTIRAATSWPSEPDRPQAIEPMVNTAIAAPNTLRAPNRSASQALIGMKMASDRR